jgi:ribosomal peptide maturation radical SAM protein 1
VPSGDATAVVLITMPWEVLELPSIQLGTLQAVLQRAGIRAEVRSLNLAFMEHCLSAPAETPREEVIRVADYDRIASERYPVGLGEWIFAVPPFRDTRELDAEYFGYLRTKGIPEGEIARARTMKTLVPSFLDRCVDEILASLPAIVGFTSVSSQNVPSLVLAKLLKQRAPSLKIMFGGGNCDGPMGAALHRTFGWIDVVVRGEAERVLPEVVRDLLEDRPVRPQPGLCYRDGERSVAVEQTAEVVPMDEVPLPMYDEYLERLRQASFSAQVLPDVRILYETARGCWWGAKSHCTFCGLNGSSMTFRSKSPERVIEELTDLAARYGRLNFQVVDNIIDLRYLDDVLPRLRDAGHDFSVFYETKANVKKAHVRLFREAGVDWIQPGIESLSTPILRLMRKGVTALQNVRLLKWCAEYGVRVCWNVIYGIPHEPAKEYERMADVGKSLTHLEPPRLMPLALDRFSPYHSRPSELGIEILGPLRYYRFVYPADEATLRDLAYSFEYRHADGHDPESYVGALRETIDCWRANRAVGFRSLRYRRGAGFLLIDDRRPNLKSATYSFGETEARIYLACDEGATPEQAWNAVRATDERGVGVEDVEEFLDELVELRLAYHEHGRYLALALPVGLRESAF